VTGPAGGRLPVVCEVHRRARVVVGEPFFAPGHPLTLGRLAAASAAPGDLVAVLPGAPGTATIQRVLGRPDDPAAVMLGLAVENGLGRDRPAAAGSAAPDPAADAGRIDLRDTLTFTIDPEGAKDHDDAISVGPDGVVSVHIADVSAHVAPASAVDVEAAELGTSTYLPGRVDAMLPAVLSDDLCSLRADADRPAVTVVLDPAGAHFHRSTIRSDHRLTYADAMGILAGGPAPPALAAALRRAADVAEGLRAARAAHGALEIAAAEPEVRLAGPEVVAAPAVSDVAHTTIEELMIAANRAVAGRLVAAAAPALHRVHEPPAAAALEALSERLAALEVPTPPMPDVRVPSAAVAYAGALSRTVAAYSEAAGRGGTAFAGLILRAMRRARYDPASLGHAGIAAPAYCHFTSPIRRYPDLVCHRALLRLLAGAAPSGGEGLEGLAQRCSDAERAAERLERRGRAICLAFALERTLFDLGWDAVFAGEVTGFLPGGAFVRFGEVFEGLLPARAWAGEGADLDPLGVALVGRRSGRRLRLGDPIDVRVDSVDRPRGRVRLQSGA
jgi:ribonuclease R